MLSVIWRIVSVAFHGWNLTREFGQREIGQPADDLGALVDSGWRLPQSFKQGEAQRKRSSLPISGA